jgi:hypothetical protein
MNYRSVRDRERAHRFSVDDYVIRLDRQAIQSAPHGEHACLVNIESLDLTYRRGTKRPRERTLLNASDELLSFLRGERLGIIDTANSAHVRRHDDGACDNGPRDWAATYFVDASQKGTSLSAKVPLDVSPPFESIRGAAFCGGLF